MPKFGTSRRPGTASPRGRGKSGTATAKWRPMTGPAVRSSRATPAKTTVGRVDSEMPVRLANRMRRGTGTGVRPKIDFFSPNRKRTISRLSRGR